jgi:hypothetical protein
MSDGSEVRLLVVPTDPSDLEVVASSERSGGSRGDSAVDPDQLQAASDALLGQCSSINSHVWFSWVEAGTTRTPTGRPVTSTATTRLAPLVRP